MSKDDTVLTMYLREINKIALLTREEENELALKAQNGDMNAKNKIVNANLRFVITVAKKYSEGNLGLLTAIEKFDTTKGYHFISYAVWWIRQSILKAICEKSRMIRLPLNRANELVQIEKAKKTISSNMSEEDEIREIAGMLNMSENHVRDMINISRDMVSLDSAVRPNDSESSSVGEFIEDSMYTRPEDEAINKSMKEDISKVLATLTDKEAEVLRYRFGLEGYKSMSLKEVGDVFNLTKERIRQIEKKAIKRLQHPTRAKRLASYIA